MSDPRTFVDAWAPWLTGGAFVLVTAAYLLGLIDITTINTLGRFTALAIVALGIDLVWGYAGILSLCQALFFCFGGYCMGMHLALHGPLDGDHHDIPRCLYVVSSVVSGFQLPWFWKPFQTLPAAIVLGLLIPGLVAFVFGWFTFRSRVRGVYFSIITQATTVGAFLIFCQNQILLCGTNGLTNFRTLAGFDLDHDPVKLGLFLVTGAVLILTWTICRALAASRAGRLLVAVRDNEVRLRFAGYDPAAFKVFVFALGAVLAALGGMLYAPQTGIFTPSNMEAKESVLMVVWVAVGGRGTLTGAVIGALAVNYLRSVLTTRKPFVWEFVLGALFIAVVLFFPSGMLGLLDGWKGLTPRQINLKVLRWAVTAGIGLALIYSPNGTAILDSLLLELKWAVYGALLGAALGGLIIGILVLVRKLLGPGPSGPGPTSPQGPQGLQPV